MNFFKVRTSSTLLAEYDDGTVDVYLKIGFFNPVKFHAPESYATEIKKDLDLEWVEINKTEFEQLLNKQFSEYKIIDFDEADIELYHGTDAKMIRMSKEQWQAHKSYCKQAIEYLYPIFKAKFYDGNSGDYWGSIYKTSLDKETTENLIKALNSYRRMLLDHPLYQYPEGVIYLTPNRQEAIAYAEKSFAGGEFGHIAYYLCKAANMLFPDLKPDKETSSAIKYVLEFGNKEREPKIMTVRNFEIKLLKDENGGSILGHSNNGYRYPNDFLDTD